MVYDAVARTVDVAVSRIDTDRTQVNVPATDLECDHALAVDRLCHVVIAGPVGVVPLDNVA